MVLKHFGHPFAKLPYITPFPMHYWISCSLGELKVYLQLTEKDRTHFHDGACLFFIESCRYFLLRVLASSFMDMPAPSLKP